MKKLLIISSILTIGLVGCRQDVPLPPSDPEAEFFAKALVDGIQKDFFAGDDDYYMFTDYTEVDGVPHYEGMLKPSSGTGEGWTIRFRGNDEGTQSSEEAAFELGEHSLQGVFSKNLIPGEVRISNTPLFADELYSSFTWSIQFGSRTQEISPTFVWDTARFTHQPLTTLTTEVASSCKAHTSRCVDTRYPETKARFEMERLADTEFRFYVPIDEWNDIQRVNWHINGNFLGSDSAVTYTLNSSKAEILVEMSVQHTNGAGTCMTRTLELNANGPDPCMVDFNSEVGPNFTPDSVQYNTLELAYTTPQGREYSTTLHTEPGKVTIEEVTDYENDLDGRPTKKVRLTGSFLLKDANGDEIRIEDADFVIAVATRDP